MVFTEPLVTSRNDALLSDGSHTGDYGSIHTLGEKESTAGVVRISLNSVLAIMGRTTGGAMGWADELTTGLTADVGGSI